MFLLPWLLIAVGSGEDRGSCLEDAIPEDIFLCMSVCNFMLDLSAVGPRCQSFKQFGIDRNSGNLSRTTKATAFPLVC